MLVRSKISVYCKRIFSSDFIVNVSNAKGLSTEMDHSASACKSIKVDFRTQLK